MNQVVDVFALIIADVSAKLGFDVYFHHGHMREIANVISQMEGPDTDATWPIVCLLHDFKQTETYNGTDVTVTLLIIAPSMPTYVAEQRKELVFKPWLVPIYEQLKKSIAASKYIGRTSETKWPRIDHYFYGSADVMKDKNILNSWVDCIELDGLELTVHIPCDDANINVPRVLYAETDVLGKYLFIKFDRSMLPPESVDKVDFNIIVGNGSNTPDSVVPNFQDATVFICDTDGTNITYQDVVTLNIASGNIQSSDGILLTTVSNYPVTNNVQ